MFVGVVDVVAVVVVVVVVAVAVDVVVVVVSDNSCLYSILRWLRKERD